MDVSDARTSCTMMNKRILRLVRRLVVAAGTALLLWTVVIMLFEDRFIFFPSVYPEGRYDDVRFVRELTDLWFVAADGVQLHGWLLRGDSTAPTIIVSHGNAGNISHRLPFARKLQERGFNVLLYDYRGYGKSEGSPDETGVYLDGLAAYDVASRQLHVPAERIVLWGTSLGGAVAVETATRRKAEGLILESTFTSAADVAASAYPFLPVRYFLRSRFDSIRKIGTVRIPVIVMHGTHDSIIPFSFGQRLFEAANEPKTMYPISGADHNDTFWVGGEEYFKRISDWIYTL